MGGTRAVAFHAGPSAAGAFKRSAGLKRAVEGVLYAAGGEVLGELQYRILIALLYELKLRYFTISDLVRHLGVGKQRVYSSLRGLARRGYVERVARGRYRLRDGVRELLDRAIIFRRRRYAWGFFTADGARGPRDLAIRDAIAGPLLEPGLYFDNVRGRDWFGRYINGDRNRFLRPVDLEIFDGISYLEPRYATGTDLMRGWGLLVTYFSCGEIGFTGRIACSDVDEWRPPTGLVRELGVAGARRLYREVLLRGFAVRFMTLSRVAGPRAVARVLRGMAVREGRRVAGFFEAAHDALLELARMGVGWAVEMARGFALRVVSELGL